MASYPNYECMGIYALFRISSPFAFTGWFYFDSLNQQFKHPNSSRYVWFGLENGTWLCPHVTSYGEQVMANIQWFGFFKK